MVDGDEYEHSQKCRAVGETVGPMQRTRGSMMRPLIKGRNHSADTPSTRETASYHKHRGVKEEWHHECTFHLTDTKHSDTQCHPQLSIDGTSNDQPSAQGHQATRTVTDKFLFMIVI